MDALCIYITAQDEDSHIQIYSNCEEFISISAYSDEYITVYSELCEGIIISSTDCSEHIIINSDFTLGMTIYSSYVCHIDNSGYLIIENLAGDTDPPEPITLFILKNSYNEIKVQSNLDWIIN